MLEYGNRFANLPQYLVDLLNLANIFLSCRYKPGWPELIPVYNHPPFVAVITHLASDHLHRHADLYGFLVYVGQLGGDHWTFIQFYQCHSVGRIGIEAGGGFVNGGI